MKQLLDYEDNMGDRRMAGMDYRGVGNQTLTRFGYEYTRTGTIKQWEQQVGAGVPTRRYDLSYDRTDQLLGGVLREVAAGTVLGTESFSYDKGGNRLTRQKDAQSITGSYNNLNQLTALALHALWRTGQQ